MATIGTFKRDEFGFTGLIHTLTLEAFVAIEPTEKRGDKSPDYRVYVKSSGPGEIGAAWKRNRDGQEYLSVRIDDPTFPAPLDCRLVRNGSGEEYALIWDRQRARD